MIEATVEQSRLAYNALRNIGVQKLPQKPAWRLSRMLGKLKPVVADFEETQLKLLQNAGAQAMDGGMTLLPVVRGEKETEEAWKTRVEERRVAVNTLNDELRGLQKETVKIDYDPLPLEFFTDGEGTPEDKKIRFSANDLADLGPFITE